MANAIMCCKYNVLGFYELCQPDMGSGYEVIEEGFEGDVVCCVCCVTVFSKCF